MTIMMLEHADETVLAVENAFGASEAEELHERLSRIPRDRAVIIDFREVRRIEDFVIARLAPEFARRRMRALGLSEHQHRVLRYFAPEPGAFPDEHRTPLPATDPNVIAITEMSAVLVVGDDVDFRMMLSEFLSAEGYQVREAANVGAALRHIEDGRPSAIVLDCAMSSAPLILEWLRRDRSAAGVPVVVISDAERPPAGAVACLREPIERGALAAALKTVRRSLGAGEAKTP